MMIMTMMIVKMEQIIIAMIMMMFVPILLKSVFYSSIVFVSNQVCLSTRRRARKTRSGRTAPSC